MKLQNKKLEVSTPLCSPSPMWEVWLCVESKKRVRKHMETQYQ
jgi:hypothetical protein